MNLDDYCEKIAKSVDRADWVITNPPGPNADMKDKINDGGPAFPLRCEWPPEGPIRSIQHNAGMSLRDYFARGIIEGMLAQPNDDFLAMTHDSRAAWAFAQADAMLKAREQKP